MNESEQFVYLLSRRNGACIATPSLEAAIINGKYVNSHSLDCISRDFQANGLKLSKQTMLNWTVWMAERYLSPVCDFMKKCQLEAHVNQSNEIPVDVIHDGRSVGSKSYIWVHITVELSSVPSDYCIRTPEDTAQ